MSCDNAERSETQHPSVSLGFGAADMTLQIIDRNAPSTPTYGILKGSKSSPQGFPQPAQVAGGEHLTGAQLLDFQDQGGRAS